MSNIRVIAKKANVSIATVSRYLNKNGYVSEKSKLAIERAINEIGYTPNELAKAVFNKSSKIIAVMVPNVFNPFFSQLVNEIENKVLKKGYTLMLFNTEDSREKEEECIKLVESYRVAGIITSRTKCHNFYKRINTPIVSFESYISDDIISISSDNYAGGCMAFEHLYRCGCRKLLHIKGPKDFEATELRYKGFYDSATDKDISLDVLQLDADFNLTLSEADKIKLKNIGIYDGVFVFNDITAVMIMKYIKDLGFNVPKDIKIIAFDNSYISEYVTPELTTIEQQVGKIAEVSVNKLIDSIEGKDLDEKKYLIGVNLIERLSTRR